MTDTLIGAWIVVCLGLLATRRLRGESTAERAPGTWLGIVVQALGFSAIWTLRQGAAPLQALAPRLVAAAADLLGLASVLLAVAAIWTLGRQWSVVGRLLPDHSLITRGPYALVRHPIYTSMLGMLLATGLALSNAAGLAAGLSLFVLGTWLRVHYEEKLLRARLATDYDAYATRVPAFIPFPRPRAPKVR